ncbi:hypothetical protein ACE193_23845 [Bernardetia sp. OM2101]|uniref:hypothetical protein n=1 Tax=Bernardetia sp. OM2101 TaxID=3344876 RepID=UPI0035D0CEE0
MRTQNRNFTTYILSKSKISLNEINLLINWYSENEKHIETLEKKEEDLEEKNYDLFEQIVLDLHVCRSDFKYTFSSFLSKMKNKSLEYVTNILSKSIISLEDKNLLLIDYFSQQEEYKKNLLDRIKGLEEERKILHEYEDNAYNSHTHPAERN